MAFKGYVINLNRHPERLFQFYQQPDAKFFQRMPAVDKKILDLIDLESVFNCNRLKTRIFRDVTAGEIGCTLSHIQCWKAIAQDHSLNENDFVVVAEDDVCFCPQFSSVVASLIAQLKTQPYQLVILQKLFLDKSNAAFNMNLSVANEHSLTEFHLLNSANSHFFDDSGSALYLISKKLAKQLVQQLENYKPFWLADHFSTICPLEQLAILNPLISFVPDDAESDLEAEREVARGSKK